MRRALEHLPAAYEAWIKTQTAQRYGITALRRVETAELLMPLVIKGDRARETFDEAKLRAGMEKSLEKRPVSREQIDEAVSRIVHKVRSLGDREVSARAIGELVMEELRHLDEVAYVRFASVYRQFEDVEAFHEEIQRLRSARSAASAARRISV